MRDYPGWSDLINEYSEKIKSLGAVSFCISQKYGALDFYNITYCLDANFDEIQFIIEEAELKSKTICSDCGMPGNEVEINGWFRTLCNKCKAFRIER